VGREAFCEARWQGAAGDVKALLESQEIILRGTITARIPRSSLTSVVSKGDKLTVNTGDGPLVLALGASEAQKWLAALLKAPPSLATKLGIGPAAPAFVIGHVEDADLAAALGDFTAPTIATAAVLVAVLTNDADLKAAFRIAKSTAGLPLWCVHGKGKSAPISDNAIRTFLRAQGWVDSKTTAVSARLTATRYGVRSQA
jgi:hypothetical protein